MVTREEIFAYTDKLDDCVRCFPFEGDFFSAVLKHKNGRWFGVLLRASEGYFNRYGYPVPEGREVLNLKCPPDLQTFLTATKSGVLPAYHMNKKHWISIDLKSDIAFEDVKKLIEISHEISYKK